MILAVGEPFKIRMGRQMRMGVKGHQTDIADLRALDFTENLTGDILIFEGGILKGDQAAVDLTLEIAAQAEFHGTDGGERDAADDEPRPAIIEEPFLDPAAVSELLRQVNRESAATRPSRSRPICQFRVF